MSSWDTDLSPAERENWNEFVRHVREETVEKMADSAFVVSLFPDGAVDIKFAVELGLSIMLDKPIVAIVPPGAPVPSRFRCVADALIELDSPIETDAGRLELEGKLRPFIEDHAELEPAYLRLNAVLEAAKALPLWLLEQDDSPPEAVAMAAALRLAIAKAEGGAS